MVLHRITQSLIFLVACVFPWLRPYASNKLDSRSMPCVFLGYSTTQSAYFCLDRTTTRIYTSHHVIFHEYVFPFSLPNELTPVSHDDVTDSSPADTSLVSPLPQVSPQTVPSVAEPTTMAPHPIQSAAAPNDQATVPTAPSQQPETVTIETTATQSEI